MSAFSFIFGYVRIRFPSVSAGEVMNICRSHGYVYRDLSFGDDGVCISCSYNVSKRLCAACNARGITAVIEKRGGVPFLLYRYRHRYGLALGALLAVAIVFFSGRVIWDVRVEGNSRLDEAEIREVLSECGLRVGSSVPSLDTDVIENRVLILSDEISWISVNLSGTVANVEIREREPVVPAPKPTSDAANIVAARGGVIVDMEDARGEVNVCVGDAVSEGDLLIGGIYGDGDSSLRLTYARGKVWALTEREFCVSVPLEYVKRVYAEDDDAPKKEKYFIFFEKQVKFTINTGNLPPMCDTIDTVEYFRTPWGTELPFGVRTVRSYSYEETAAVRTEEEAESLALYLLRCEMESELADAELVSKKLSGRVENGAYILTCRAECIENIARTVEIDADIG